MGRLSLTAPLNCKHNRYRELDALRGFAALSVVFYHFTLGKGQSKYFDFGLTGVNLFFLISGFVIFMSIEKVTSARQFIINRVARLYPTYWVCVSITFSVMVFLRIVNFNATHDSHAGIYDYLANLTMFQYYLRVKDLDAPYWTMIIEMLFYLFIVLLYLLKGLKHIITVGVVFNVIILIHFLLVLNGLILPMNQLFPLADHFPLFFAGIIFYKIAAKGVTQQQSFSLIAFCLTTQIIIYRFAGANPDHLTQWQYAASLTSYFVVFALFVSGKLKFIINKPALFLGRISFALYLSHYYLFTGITGVLQRTVHLPFWIVTIFVALPVAIFLAYLITVFIDEKEAKKFKMALLKLADSSFFN